MFKDLYKKANDKISTDDAYLRVMEQVNSKSRKNKYGFAKIALLAACFILTFSMLSVYENLSPKEEVPFKVVTPENLPTDTPAEVKTTPVTENQSVTASVTVPVAQPEIVPETDTLVLEEIGEEVILTAPQNSFVKNQGIPENIGTSVARFTLGDTVTKDEYYEYLGKNLESSLVLPDGFFNETPDEHNLCLTENENFDDRWTFYFTQGDNSIFITTTKNTENFLNIMSSDSFEKSNVKGIDALLFEEDAQKLAVLEAGGVSYTVSSYGISDEDFQSLIISLTE